MESENIKSKLAPAINYARQFIFTNGIRSFNIDRMAEDLHISKKSIYKYCKTKDTFVELVLQTVYDELFADVGAVAINRQSPVESFYLILSTLFSNIQQQSARTLLDVKIFYPRVWESVLGFRQQIIQRMVQCLQIAQESGQVRRDVDLDFIVDLVVKIVQSTFQPEIFITFSYSITDLVRIFVDLIMNGLLEKGHTFDFSRMGR